MKNSTGYKKMLRDRCPKIVDRALKWQKAKERWLNHTYQSFIGIFCDKEERYHVTRIILGIAKEHRKIHIFNFDKSIDWENLSKEEEIYWKRVSSWVNWFYDNYSDIRSEYESSLAVGKDEFAIKVEIINSHLSSLLPDKNADEEEKQAKYEYVNRLVDFLINCFNGRI